jgi:hypothetical protein
MRGFRKRIHVLTVIVLLASWPAGHVAAQVTGDLAFLWLKVLVRRVEPTFRELHLLDYQSGLTPAGYQVAGSVRLNEFKTGDHLLTLVGINNPLILYIRKIPPPVEDARYQEMLRRVLAEEGQTP